MSSPRWLPRTGFVATLAVGVSLVGSSLYGLAQVGEDLELAAAARPSTTFVADRGDSWDCPRRDVPVSGWGHRL